MNDTVRELLRSLPSRLKSPWVFPSATGETPLEAGNYINRVFEPALKRAAIENFRWHDLRHTFASRLVMKGVDLPTLQEIMSHKTIAMTLRYAPLSQPHRLDAVQRLNRPRTGTTTGTTPSTKRASTGGAREVPEPQGKTSAPAPTRTGDLQVRSSQKVRTHPTRHHTMPENPRHSPGDRGLGWARVGTISDTTRTLSRPRIRAARAREPSMSWGAPRGRRWSSPSPRGGLRRW